VAEKGGLASLPNQEESLSLVEKQQLLSERIRREGETSSAPDLKEIGRTIQEVHDNMSPLDKAALYTAPIPILGDIVGFAADGAALYDDPSLTNAGLMAAGLIPFVPSGGVTRTAQKLFTNLRNDIPGFYGTSDPIKQAIAAGRTIPEGITNIARARNVPTDRAIQSEYNISVADQKAAQNAIKASEKVADEVGALKKKLKEMEDLGTKPGGAYTGEWNVGAGTQKTTQAYKDIKKEANKLAKFARTEAKKAMGQLNQSLSMTKQYGGLKGLLKNIEGVDHIKTFEKFNVDQYFDEVGDLSGLDKEDISGMFDQIKRVQGMDPSKPYQMNIRRVSTQSAGNLDPTTGKQVYKSVAKEPISLDNIKKDVFPELKRTKSGTGPRKTYTSDKEFLDALTEAGVLVRNRDDVLKGRAAIITGSGKSDAWELGGVNYMTSINKDGKAVTIVNDEHDLFSFKLPGADRYMNVSEPIPYDLAKTKELTSTQQAAKKRLSSSKTKAVKEATKKYESILKDLNVDIAEKVPLGFGSREQYLRALTVANLKPSHKDYSRLVKDFGIGMPVRAGKAVLGTEEEEEVVEVERKKGGSVIERNPYKSYEPKAI
tara:strand:+ start:887 stop:2686 length:1800 start_codon:yes stop_codon:yes gene_type:complete